MKTKIILNLFGKQVGCMCTPIVINVSDYASFEDAMKMAKFKASKIDKRLFDVTITSI